MNNETHYFSKYLNTISSRHHYIPKFFISGFANSDGLLYLYDKQKDEIFKNPRSPKSVFFELDRNTLELNSTTKISIIEDLLYKEIDDKTSKIIRRYQNEELSKIDFKTEDAAELLFFLISLFWRIPKTDYAANDLMERSTITTNGIDSEILRRDPAYRKISRAVLFKHHISEMKNFGTKGKKWINIHQNQNSHYVIGDYPILFRKQPVLFGEFNDIDILVAIGSNRIYSSTNNTLTNFAIKNSYRYNACIINQSVNYVACGDLNTLKNLVLFYKKLKETGLIYILDEETFKTE